MTIMCALTLTVAVAQSVPPAPGTQAGQGTQAAQAAQVPTKDAFDIRTDLQGLYDEISQATLQFLTPQDVDEFHEVMYTPDWEFVDASGGRHPWAQEREQAVANLASPSDWIAQPIQSVRLKGDQATVVVRRTTVRTVVDAQGKYGRPGVTHTLTETATFRDGWVRTPAGWKFRLRQQLRQAKVEVDKPESLS